MAKRRSAARSSGSSFRLTAPSKLFFFISLALAVLALVSMIVFIPSISVYAAWIAIVAYAVLAIGVAVKGV